MTGHTPSACKSCTSQTSHHQPCHRHRDRPWWITFSCPTDSTDSWPLGGWFSRKNLTSLNINRSSWLKLLSKWTIRLKVQLSGGFPWKGLPPSQCRSFVPCAVEQQSNQMLTTQQEWLHTTCLAAPEASTTEYISNGWAWFACFYLTGVPLKLLCGNRLAW